MNKIELLKKLRQGYVSEKILPKEDINYLIFLVEIDILKEKEKK